MAHRLTCTVSLLLAAGGVAAAQDARPEGLDKELAAPFQVEAVGKPINVDIAHAAPFFGDFDGDGINDLLVGQFGEGKLRIYKNTGTNAEPKFGEHEWFMAGGAEGKVPFG
jgi:hypothetical protein